MKSESIYAIYFTLVALAILGFLATISLKGCDQLHEVEMKCIEKGMIMLPNHICVGSIGDSK